MFKGKFEMEECRAEKSWADFYKIRGFKFKKKNVYTKSFSSNPIFLQENQVSF